MMVQGEGRSRARGALRGVLTAVVAVLAAATCLAGTAHAQAVPDPPDAAALLAELEAKAAEIQENPSAAAEILQDYADEKVADAVDEHLPTVLSAAASISTPVCPALGTVGGLLPGLNLNHGQNSLVGSLDFATSEMLYTQYTALYEKLLAPLVLPPVADPVTGPVSLIQTLLGTLLKVNYHTVYYPPNGGAPIVRDTPAFLNLPMVIDVDGQVGPGGFELCASTSLDLATGEVKQNISKMPLARATLPVDVRADYLLGLLNSGYETKGSVAPTIFSTVTNTGGTVMNTSLTEPGPTITQTAGLGITLGSFSLLLENRLGSLTPPARYQFAVGNPGRDESQSSSQQAKGIKSTYTAPTVGGSVDYSVKLVLGSLTTGGGTTLTPSPQIGEWCNSSKGYCSNEPGIDPEQFAASGRLSASQPVKVDQHPFGTTSTACSAFASAAADTIPGGSSHFTARTLAWAQRTGANGQAWVDTNSHPASGCLATSSTTGNLPAGFSANDRRATWDGASTPNPLTKTGTINCPVGTTLTGGSFGISFGLSRYLCSSPPVNVVLPAITATSTNGRSRSLGTWYPSLTGAVQTTVATQWLRCNAMGAVCLPIAGATSSTYTKTVADTGMTLRVDVTVTNPYGTATARSNAVT